MNIADAVLTITKVLSILLFLPNVAAGMFIWSYISRRR